jgi:hypothetical protein
VQDGLPLPDKSAPGTWTKADGVIIPKGFSKVEISGDKSRSISPDDPSETAFTVDTTVEGEDIGPWDEELFGWLYDSKLVCADKEYDMIVLGLRAEEGKMLGQVLLFFVPLDSEFDQCALRLPDGSAIDLASFFE